eukprot:4430906-Amphidinium_carterae.1
MVLLELVMSGTQCGRSRRPQHGPSWELRHGRWWGKKYPKQLLYAGAIYEPACASPLAHLLTDLKRPSCIASTTEKPTHHQNLAQLPIAVATLVSFNRSMLPTA